MECHEARLLIDERVHGSLNADLSAQLDGHLKTCADCREDLRQLEKMRELLAVAKRDTPTDVTLAAIWQAVAAAQTGLNPTSERKPAMSSAVTTPRSNLTRPARSAGPNSQKTHWKLVAASSLVAAAVMMVAFVLGRQFEPRTNGLLQDDKVVMITELRQRPQAGEHEDVSKSGADLSDHYETAEPGGISSQSVPNKWEAPKLPAQSVPSNSSGAAPSSGGSSSTSSSSGGGGDFEGESRPVDPESEPAAPVLAQKYLAQSDAPDRGNPKEAPASIELPTKGKETQGLKKGDLAADTSRQKIIKTGELTVEVKNFAEASRAVDSMVIKVSGILADSRTYDMPGATKRGEIVVRIAPEKFEETFSELKKLGTVLQERAGGQDITAQYTDMDARIKNLQIAEARLQELIKEKTFMDKISSLLEVERELARVRGEIESMQGTMRVWNDQIALSTIHLSLTEPTRPVPSGSLSVEVSNLADAKKTLDAALTNAAGNLLSGQISKRSDGTLMGTYSLRVKFGRFGELAAAIKGLGRVQDEHIQNQPMAGGIPEGAQDVPADLSLVLFERSIQLPSGNLSLEVQTLADAVKTLDVELAAAQASIVSNQTQRQGDGSTTANITLRVRAGNFAALLDKLPQLGRMTQRTVSGESGKVQGGAADVPVTVNLYLYEQHKQVPTGNMTVEVESFTISRDKLSALIKEQQLQVLGSDSQQRSDGTWAGNFKLGIKAEKMDSIVSDIEKFGRVKTRQLQGLGLGDLSKVDPNVIGEVAIIIEEKPALAPQEEGSFRLMLRDTFGGFLTSMSYIVRGLGVMIPWAALIALIVGLIWRVTKRSASAPATAASSSSTSPSDPPKSEGSGPKGQGSA